VRHLALVVPCYNEAARLPVDRLRAFLTDDKSVGLVLVDDGSTDATRARLEAVGEGFEERVQVLTLPRNQGKAEAVRQGMLRALEGGAEGVGYWDADLATPLEELERLRAVLEQHPEVVMVLGARVNLLGRHIERSPLRHYLGRIFATAASVTLGLPVYDTQCGAKLFRVTPELGELFAEPFETRWLFDVEILARFLGQRRRAGGSAQGAIVEYPLHEWRDVAGSKVRTFDFVTGLIGLLRIRRRYF
jgi:glycosyltransferase involved in cell wall biosynthesis